MPTRKIRDLEKHETCRHPEHEPPKHRVYSDGVYEHICPGCGRRVEFTVHNPIYTSTWDRDAYERLRKSYEPCSEHAPGRP